MNPKEYIKAILAGLGTLMTALGVAAKDGIDLSEGLIVTGGTLGAFALTYAWPNKTPTEIEKAEDGRN